MRKLSSQHWESDNPTTPASKSSQLSAGESHWKGNSTSPLEFDQVVSSVPLLTTVKIWLFCSYDGVMWERTGKGRGLSTIHVFSYSYFLFQGLHMYSSHQFPLYLRAICNRELFFLSFFLKKLFHPYRIQTVTCHNLATLGNMFVMKARS